LAKKKFWGLLDGFEMDLRSLALFRLLFGSCLFIDIFYRLFYVSEFYSDQGVLPRDVLTSQFLNLWEWSVFLFSGQVVLVTALLVVMLFFIATFTLGFYTRVSSFIVWVLLVSLHARNQVVLHGGDDVFRALMFWCMFAPLGAEFSIDRYMNPPAKGTPRTVLSFGAASLMLQLLFVYIFTALLKWDREWWVDGTAVYYALSLDQFTSSVGQFFRNFPLLMRGMTYSTVMLEFLGPFSVIMPIYFLRRRIFVPAAFIIFHFGLAINMVLGMFPWTCMAAWLMVLPPEFWAKFQEPSMGWLKRWAESLKRAGWSGQKPVLKYGVVTEATAAVFLALVFAWNVSQLDVLKLEKSPGLSRVLHAAEIYQRWSMFAPYPRKDDGWYVIESKFFNGETWNTFLDQPVTFDKPDDVAGTFKNSMWRKYLTNIWLQSFNKHRVHFGRYLCREWNERQTDPQRRINTIQIHYMMEMTPPPGEDVPEPKKETIWKHYCYDKPADWKD